MAGTVTRAISAALATAILTYQLFSPNFVGLADNGDFPRIAGHFSLCPAEGWDKNRFSYFIPNYKVTASCHWESGVPTSARLLTQAARKISPGELFPIQTQAALQATVLIALITAWPPLLLFADLANTAYLNSFYLEGFALLALLAVILAARNLLRRKTDVAITLYTISAIFLITAKLQHATLALPLAVFLIAQAKWRAAFPAAAILLAATYMSTTTPQVYKVTNLWNSVFVGLVPNSPTALADLHLSPAYAPYSNRNAYEFPSQPQAEYWETRLGDEMSYTKLAAYYLNHPTLAWNRIVASAQGLKHLRPDYLGNTQPGTPPFTQSHRIDFFSAAKSKIYNAAPYYAIAIYSALAFLIPRRLALLLFSLAATEFLTSTFADSVLDYRHHALLHQLLDLWLLCALCNAIQMKLIGQASKT